MRTSRLLRATSFRLALAQTLIFAAAFALAGVIATLIVRRDEMQAVDAEISAQTADLRALYEHGGLGAVQATVAARQRDPSIWEFRVEDARGARLCGDLPAGQPWGWSTRRLVEGDLPDNQSEIVRALTGPLAGGLRLSVGEDLGQRERSDNALMALVASLAAAAAALSLATGAWMGWRTQRRLDEMAAAMERYGAGDHAARAPVQGRGGDLDQLAAALNRMLERTSRLMEGIRQISADIAHDLRRPLARHNARIVRTLQGPASAPLYRQALEDASAEVADVLRTFQALLHIAELEAGAPGLATEPVDLADVAARVVEAFRPMAEEGGRRLELADPPALRRPLPATADLLSQLAANLVENALVHTPPGARVRVAVAGQGLRLEVCDDGPGVPEPELERIFQRFTRLDASRSTPGTGLGLALSAAIARAFDGVLYAENRDPGLRVVADFTRSAQGVR